MATESVLLVSCSAHARTFKEEKRDLVCNSLHRNGRGSGVQLSTPLTFFRMRELTLGRGIRSPGSWPRSVQEVEQC